MSSASGSGRRRQASERSAVRRRRALLAAAGLVLAGGVATAVVLLQGSDESVPGLASPSQPALPEPRPEDPRIRSTKITFPLTLTLVDARSDGEGGLVILRARNRGTRALSISDRAVRVRQDGMELRPAPFPPTRLPRFGPSVAPGGSARATLWFPRLRATGAVISVPWFTTNVDVSPSPVEFRVAVRDVARVTDARS